MQRYNLRRSQPTPPFRFLELPPELRNFVYKLVVVSNEPIAPRLSGHGRLLMLPTYNDKNHVQPAITKVSRQLRQEALPLFYGENTFDLSHGCSIPLQDFMKIGTENIDCIQCIIIRPGLGRRGWETKVEIRPDGTGLRISCSLMKLVRKHLPENKGDYIQRVIKALEEDAEIAESEVVRGSHLLKLVVKTDGYDTDQVDKALVRIHREVRAEIRLKR